MQLNNTYLIMRHGGAVSNKEKFHSNWPEKRENPLTEDGRQQVANSIPQLKKENIDLIFSSDLQRTEETAQIVADALNLDVNFDTRLREFDVGILNGESVEETHRFYKEKNELFFKRIPGGENRRDIKERMMSFLMDVDEDYNNKNILIISHGDPLFVLEGAVRGLSEEDMISFESKGLKLETAEVRKIN